MAILSDEEWAARLAERAERERRYAAQVEPTRPTSPPSPSLDLNEFAAELSETLQQTLDAVKPEINSIIAAIREHQDENNANESEDKSMADEPVVLNQRERELVETFRRQEAERLARETLSANERAELERIDSLAAKALSKQGTLTPEETNALRTRVTSVLAEMNSGGRS